MRQNKLVALRGYFKPIYEQMREGFYDKAMETLQQLDVWEKEGGFPEIRVKLDACLEECRVNQPLFDEYARNMDIIRKGERVKGLWNLEKLLQSIDALPRKGLVNTGLVPMIKSVLDQ